MRRWTSWYRWVTLAMLGAAVLTIAAAIESARGPAAAGQIPLTRNEIATAAPMARRQRWALSWEARPAHAGPYPLAHRSDGLIRCTDRCCPQPRASRFGVPLEAAASRSPGREGNAAGPGHALPHCAKRWAVQSGKARVTAAVRLETCSLS